MPKFPGSPQTSGKKSLTRQLQPSSSVECQKRSLLISRVYHRQIFGRPNALMGSFIQGEGCLFSTEIQRMRAKPAKVGELATETIDARLLLKVLSDFRRGDFTTRLPSEQTGLTGKIYDALNEVIELNERMAKEFDRVANVVGKEGRIKQRASLPSATGSWGACIDSVNTLIADLVQPTTEVARVIGAVAKGDLSQTMSLEIEGRPLN